MLPHSQLTKPPGHLTCHPAQFRQHLKTHYSRPIEIAAHCDDTGLFCALQILLLTLLLILNISGKGRKPLTCRQNRYNERTDAYAKRQYKIKQCDERTCKISSTFSPSSSSPARRVARRCASDDDVIARRLPVAGAARRATIAAAAGGTCRTTSADRYTVARY